MLTNLAEKGIKRIVKPPRPDIEIIKQYRPANLCKLGVVADAYGLPVNALFLNGVYPDWLVSGYRDQHYKKRTSNGSLRWSSHCYGGAFDVYMGTYSIIKQIEFVKLSVIDSGLFNRGGIYVGQNTCHVDTCDDEWMYKYNGTKYWVWHLGKYIGFSNFDAAASHAISKTKPGEK